MKYAARALRPNAARGLVSRRHPRPSTAQWKIASACAASPALKSANELVHKFLLIGSARPHARPTTVATSPAAQSDHVVRERISHAPAKTPQSAVAIAGIVLRM